MSKRIPLFCRPPTSSLDYTLKTIDTAKGPRPPPPAYRRRGLGRPPSGGRAAVSISSRPFLFFAGRRQLGQVASPPARSLSPARPAPVFLREEPQPQPRSRAARAPRVRLTRVRLAAGWPIFCPTSGAEDHSRTASAAPPTPCARSAGGTWTAPHLYPSPNSLIHFPLHLHLLQPSSSCPSRLMRIHPHTPPTPHPPRGRGGALVCVLLASLVHILVSTTQLFRVRVRGGALVGSRGRPPGLCGGANREQGREHVRFS